MPVETYSEGEMPYEDFDTMVEDAGGTEVEAMDDAARFLQEEERDKRMKRNARERKLKAFVGKAGKTLEKVGSTGAKFLGGLFTAKPPEPDIYTAPQTAPPAPLPEQQAMPPARPGEGFFGSGGSQEPVDKAGFFGGGNTGENMFSMGGGGLSPLVMPQRQARQFDLFSSQPMMEGQGGGMMDEQQTAPELDLFGSEGGGMWGIGEGSGAEGMLTSGEGNAEAMLFGGAQPRGRKQPKQEGFDLFGSATTGTTKRQPKQEGFDLFGSADIQGMSRGGTAKQGKKQGGGFDLFGGATPSRGKMKKGSEGVTLF